jgi:hypothetical protein
MNLLRRKLTRWLAPLLVAGGCLLPEAANAQPGPPAGGAPKTEEEIKNPALQYMVAFFALLGIMVILCKPSRKN